MKKSRLLSTVSISLVICYLPKTAFSQIVPDNTLPTNSSVNVTDNLTEIDDGSVRGSNLFHSFSEFNVAPGAEAYFNNAANIENIFSRVTGNNLSAIEGLISNNGSANLFLINPNGIIFGPDAALDIGGSFSAATADAITFSDGSYSAVAPQDSILSVEIPLGVQLGSQAADVIIEGLGNNTFWNENDETVTDFRNQGLTAEGEITLIGGNVILDAGNLTASDRISLIAGGDGTVTFGDRTTTNLEEAGDILLDNEASALSDTEIKAIGENVLVLNGSALLAQNGASEGINIDAADTFLVEGENSFGDFPSYVSTDVVTGEAPGGDIRITANRAIANFGGQVNAATFTAAPGGDVNIIAEDTILAESGGSFTGSAFLADTFGEGNAGTLNLVAPNIAVTFGGQIGSSTFGSGKAGTINVTGDLVEVDGSEFGFPSEIFSRSQGPGSAGKVTIDANEFRVTNDGQISTTAFDTGAGGEIKVNANTIFIGDTFDEEDPTLDTGIFSGSGSGEVTDQQLGDGGTIDIDADLLEIKNKGIVSATSFSGGNGGSVKINAENIELGVDSNLEGSPEPGLVTSVALSSGNAGSIAIEGDSIKITDGAQIGSTTDGSGSAGNIEVTGNELIIEGFDEAGSSAILSSAVNGSGNGGNIEITAKEIELREGGTINASNFPTRNDEISPGTGMAGSISLNAQNLTITGETEPTNINTSTNAGGGGNIKINSQTTNLGGATAAITAEGLGSSDGGSIAIDTNTLNLQQQGRVTVSATAEGNAGNINIEVEDLNGDRGNVLAESQISGGGDIDINSENIDLNQQSLISTSVRDSNGGGGNITIDNGDLILLRNNSDIRANAVFGPGGNIDITSPLLFTDFTSDIDASSEFGLDGTIEITTEFDEELAPAVLTEDIIDPTGLIVSACPISNDNSFAYIGNGGIPQTPAEAARITRTWLDERPSENGISPVLESKKPADVSSKPAPRRANALHISPNGEVQLVAAAPLKPMLRSGCQQ